MTPTLPDRETMAPLRLLVHDRLHGRESPAVALLMGGDTAKMAGWVLAANPGARMDTFDPALPSDELHLALAAHGPFDLMVEDGPAEGRAGRVPRLFFHLVRGGALVLRKVRVGASVDGGDPAAVEPGRGLVDLVADLTERTLVKGRPLKPGARPDRERLARAVRSLTVTAGHVELVNGELSAAQVGENEMNGFLDAVGPEVGRVLENRPALEFPARSTLLSSLEIPPYAVPTTYAVPATALREYHDVVASPGQILTRGGVILPDSFRHHQRPRPGNRYAPGLTPGFSTVPDVTDAPRLDGAYFYLDSEYRGHFGHAMTEQLSRLWAWDAAKRAEPDLKVLLHVKNRQPASFESDLYAAAGVPPEDLVFATGPVRVERLLAATPMFSQPDYVHPDIEQVWGRVSDNLAAAAPPGDRPQRFFCARRLAKRPCRNAEEVEQLFVEHGFTVLFPEDYSLAEQAALFREAEVIGGFAGSALFNLILSRSAKQVVMVSSESYTAQNEEMVAAVLGHEMAIAWCRPEIAMPPGRWVKEAFHSAYTFDLDREGVFVRDHLGSL